MKCTSHCIKMEFQKILNLSDITPDDNDLLSLATRKWIKVYHQSGRHYNVNREIRIKTSMLRLELCGFSDAYFVVKITFTVDG